MITLKSSHPPHLHSQPPPPLQQPHPPTSCSSYINNFLLSGNRLSFYCYSRNLNLFCNFRHQVVGSKALIFHFSQESFLLSCFFIHIWRISHLCRLCDKKSPLYVTPQGRGETANIVRLVNIKVASEHRVMLDIPSQYMHCCPVPLCQVYCVIV